MTWDRPDIVPGRSMLALLRKPRRSQRRSPRQSAVFDEKTQTVPRDPLINASFKFSAVEVLICVLDTVAIQS
jgi:hypothetical protein